MKKMSIHCCSKIFLFITFGLFCGVAVAQKVQLEYDLSIAVDPAMRAQYFQQTGKVPTIYDQALNLVKGSMQVATVVDRLDISKSQYHIASNTTPVTAVSLILPKQKIIRDSVGINTSTGMQTNLYQEKRGNSELYLAKLDVSKKTVNFYRTSLTKPITGSASFSGRLFDMATVGYQFIGKPLPLKPITIPVTDGRSVKNYTLVRGEPWMFPLGGEKVKAIRYYKTTSKQDTATFEIWYSEQDHLPLRSIIGLNGKYGITIQLDLKSLPKL